MIADILLWLSGFVSGAALLAAYVKFLLERHDRRVLPERPVNIPMRPVRPTFGRRPS